MTRSLDRRTVLAGLLVLAAGCDRATPAASPSPSPTTRLPGADRAALDAALADEVALVGSYDATSAAHPQWRVALAPLRDDHASAVTALRAAGARNASPAAPTISSGVAASSTPAQSSGAATANASAASSTLAQSSAPSRSSPPVTPGASGRSPATALTTLRAAEHAVVGQRTSAAATASAPVALLLGGVAAAAAGHDVVLASLRAAR